MSVTPNIDTIKGRMKATWMAGDYAQFATYFEPGALEILAGWGLAAGSRLLDVACGAGQIAIPAARAGVKVTGVDIATNSIQHARARAAAESLVAQFDEGDAEKLPYPDASFDTVVSVFGAMFAPRPGLVAAELVRVCRSEGRIIMVNWTPDSFVGQVFKTTGKHVPPTPGFPSPLLWGDEASVRARLLRGLAKLSLTRRIYPSITFPFGVPEVVEFYRQYYGPTNRSFDVLDADGQAALRHDLEQVFSAYNCASDGTTSIEAEYLEVVAIRA